MVSSLEAGDSLEDDSPGPLGHWVAPVIEYAGHTMAEDDAKNELRYTLIVKFDTSTSSLQLDRGASDLPD